MNLDKTERSRTRSSTHHALQRRTLATEYLVMSLRKAIGCIAIMHYPRTSWLLFRSNLASNS